MTSKLTLALLALAAAGCAGSSQAERATDVAVVREAFQTAADTSDNVDSPAVWHGPAGQHWILSTAKGTHVMLVHDAATGREVRRVGTRGSGDGQFDRPNGVAVVDDLMVVVERDNRRVQVFALPDFTPLGHFGANRLRKPYGVSVYATAPGRYRIYVTDSYEGPDESVPPDAELGERVHSFTFVLANGRVAAQHERAFGDTSGPGRLLVVESILADVERGRLLIAEEVEGGSHVKEYTLDGRYVGTALPEARFPNQAEGLALYACPGGQGYYVATDQGVGVNTFHVFDRVSLAHVGAFEGPRTLNTDGIALTQTAFGPFPAGAFFAVHDDQAVSGFSWADVARALDLRTC